MNKIFSLIFIVLMSAGIISCEEKVDVVTNPTMKIFLQSKPELSTFATALEKAQLELFRDGQGPFTFFAPTNTAFTAAGISPAAISASQLSYLILYHVINALVLKRDMTALNSFARTTQNTNAVYLGNEGDSIYVDGTNVISPDNLVSNGVVHIINRFNIPPNLRGNIQNILNTTGIHTLFSAALVKAGRATVGTSASIYTVLAPTDAAMTAAGFTSATIASATVGRIDTLVRYHIFSGPRLFTNDFIRSPTPGTFLGAVTTLTTANRGRQVKGRSNPAPVNIITSDLLGTNGVVHVLDGVLQY